MVIIIRNNSLFTAIVKDVLRLLLGVAGVIKQNMKISLEDSPAGK